MCGINGIVGKDTTKIADMSAATVHRGPDAVGLYERDGIALAHNRLSIIDLSDVANQPMESSDGRYVIVFNGEIYNFKDLRADLNNWQFTTQSDTEVLLAAYAKWGVDMLKRLNGIFAFALWDAKKETLLLARDRMGVKPLFYTRRGRALYFSSELRSLCVGADLHVLHEESSASFFGLNYIPGPETAVTGISKLPPAHYAEFSAGRLMVHRFWTPATPRVSSVTTDAIRNTLGEAVTAQLVSDRPVGVFLSGGFDSTIVAYHAQQSLQNLRTFTSRFVLDGVDASKYNVDADRAEMTAQQFGTSHTTYEITPQDIRDNFEAALLALDEPIANPTTVSQYLLSKWVRRDGVVVALGGDGGDELFAGYERHRIVQAAAYYQKLPQFMRQVFGAAVGKLKKLNTPLGVPMHMQLMTHKLQSYQTLIPKLPVERVVEELLSDRYNSEHINTLSAIDQFMRVDRETWLVDESLAHTDAMSMVHGLEIRVPFLHESVVTLTDSVYGKDKCSLRVSKPLIRNAYRGVLPEYLYEGPKRGWFSPGAKWLRDPVIYEFAKNVLSDGYYSGLSTHVEWQEVQKMLESHRISESYHLYPLWNLLVLQVWVRQNQLHF